MADKSNIAGTPRRHKINWLNQDGYKGETLNFIRSQDRDGKIGWHCDSGIVTPFLDEAMLAKPLHWQVPRAIFWSDMTDIFGEWVPNEWLDRCFAVMALTPQHRHLLLTKRPERMATYLANADFQTIIDIACFQLWPKSEDYPEREILGEHIEDEGWPLPNVWLGATVENQAAADERLPHLLKCPASVLWVSYEPALGPVDFTPWLYLSGGSATKIGWLICGGESGSRARPVHLDWVRQSRDQCEAAATPFFFKQWGEWAPRNAGINEPCDSCGEGIKMVRVGKKNAGRLLDGKEWLQFPCVV